jgi:putative ABC transport system permease protein
VKAGDLAELGLRNLREAILRNSLTTLGVAVGVASLVAMGSLAVGLQQLASRRLAHSGLFDTVIVMSKTNMRGFRANSDGPPSSRASRELDESARKQIAALPNVVEVYPQIRLLTEVRYDNNSYFTTLAGISPLSKDGGSFDDLQGRFFSSPQADEAILQVEFAKELSKQPNELIGKEISIRYAERQAMPGISNSGASSSESQSGQDSDSSTGFSIVTKEKKVAVVGIVEGEPAAGYGGVGNGRIFIPVEVAETLRAAQANDLRDILRGGNARPGYGSLTARASSPSKVEGLESSIKSMGFATFSLLDATKNLRMFFVVFDQLLAIFGSLALAVATLGIVNTLMMAILERRREIGVLKALGADDRDVQQLFFVEAGIMGLVGGAIGVVLGWIIDRGITIVLNFYLRRQNLPSATVFSLPWWLSVVAIVIAVVVSLIAGLYPASRAARLQPVEALRYE